MVVPVLALPLLAATWGTDPAAVVLVVVGAVLVGCVLAAVHHAEVVAHRVGEPFGSLVLAVAVTVIEVALIVTLMVSGGSETATLARDTVFAAVMISCNGILGLSVLVGALCRHTASFNAEGTATALATVATLATLSLVLPTFTTSRPGPEFSSAQLAFAAVASLVLYRHRDYFVVGSPMPGSAWVGAGTAATAGAGTTRRDIRSSRRCRGRARAVRGWHAVSHRSSRAPPTWSSRAPPTWSSRAPPTGSWRADVHPGE